MRDSTSISLPLMLELEGGMKSGKMVIRVIIPYAWWYLLIFSSCLVFLAKMLDEVSIIYSITMHCKGEFLISHHGQSGGVSRVHVDFFSPNPPFFPHCVLIFFVLVLLFKWNSLVLNCFLWLYENSFLIFLSEISNFYEV